MLVDEGIVWKSITEAAVLAEMWVLKGMIGLKPCALQGSGQRIAVY